jgi:predicted molibdopterin-dependent oxidoreductase YjgC
MSGDGGAGERLGAETLTLEIDGRPVQVPVGSTLLDACRALGIDVPTLCWAPNLEPATACRVCVVELVGSRVLVPSCGRAAEPGMQVRTDSERVRTSRRLVLELLGSSVDLSAADELRPWMAALGVDPARFGPRAETKAHEAPTCDNSLYSRDYAKCVLCYKCVDACGIQAQGTFAITVAGRGFDAHVSTELAVPLPDSACVYCGNCIGVCPTGALVPNTEFERRQRGDWRPADQTRTDTICPYCGVGCTLTLHVQDDEVVKVTSPHDVSVTDGMLCIKGRFGTGFVKAEKA